MSDLKYLFLLCCMCFLQFSPTKARNKCKGELTLQAVQGKDTAQSVPNSEHKKKKGVRQNGTCLTGHHLQSIQRAADKLDERATNIITGSGKGPGNQY